MDTPGKGSSIAAFFAGRAVFLTGVTGFVGKVILDKLLRSCPGILYVFVLIRETKGKSVNERLAEVLNSPRLKLENPGAVSKAVAVKGNVTTTGLGMCDEDKDRICKDVSIVIHSAASVKFNESFRDAIHTNLVGTLNVLALATEMTGLEAFVHISTAYSNCNQKDVLETVYNSGLKPSVAIEMVKGWTEEQAADVTQALEGRPNFYTLSKSLAEQLVSSYGATLPVCIIRPSIVSAALQEPVAGWIDNYNGATGVLMAAIYGLLRVLHVSSRNSTLDIIPVDLVANLTIAAAWFTATNKKSQRTVFHCCSGGSNPLTLAKLTDYWEESLHETAFKNMTLYPAVLHVRSKSLFHLLDFLLQRIPCQLMDFKAKLLFKQKPEMMRAYRKMSTMLESLDFFITHEFNFSSTNTRFLYSRLSDFDQKLFNFDADSINWQSYIHSYVNGMRIFLLRETEEDLLAARSRRKRFNRSYRAMKGILFVLMILAMILVVAYFGIPFISRKMRN